MIKYKIYILLCFLFIGCASKPSPEWLNRSHDQLENYKISYLSGSEKIAAKQFQIATNEIKKSGDMDILSRAYLIRMALQVAALEDITEEDYLRANTLQPSLINHSFYKFLKGDINSVDDDLLPGRYRSFFRVLKRHDDAGLLQEIEAIEDPFSQLIATGVVVRLRRDTEVMLKRAEEIASKEGWKKPLIAYMKSLQAYYEGNKLNDQAADIKQRINVIEN